MESEIDLKLLSFGVNTSAHEFIELVSECFVEVGHAWCEDSLIQAACYAAARLADVGATRDSIHLQVLSRAIPSCSSQ